MRSPRCAAVRRAARAEPGATSGSAEPRAPVRPTSLAPAGACVARTPSSGVPASKLSGRFAAQVVAKAGGDDPSAAAGAAAWAAATDEPSEGVDAVTAVNASGSCEAGDVEGDSVEEEATPGLPAASVAAPAACVGPQTGAGVRSRRLRTVTAVATRRACGNGATPGFDGVARPCARSRDESAAPAADFEETGTAVATVPVWAGGFVGIR